jgi:hypothetical protein
MNGSDPGVGAVDSDPSVKPTDPGLGTTVSDTTANPSDPKAMSSGTTGHVAETSKDADLHTSPLKESGHETVNPDGHC